MDNLGSFGNGQMSPELQAAISRRGNSGGATNAVMTGAPTFNPSIQPSQANSAPAPAGGAFGSPPSSPSLSSGTGVGLPANTPESELIVKALASRLSTLGKLQGA